MQPKNPNFSDFSLEKKNLVLCYTQLAANPLILFAKYELPFASLSVLVYAITCKSIVEDACLSLEATAGRQVDR